ncbi:5' exonuclease Apollo [Abrus precatorius]|uniref:Protein artemis n=1 Tax=Abrus precatorius TaxID=3816 RepID=A0A8B8L0P8_ABRPR|nr:5' exonuclease Apollo [Abrus precatorius]
MEMGLISVDSWAEGSQLYFLTHLHSDHTHGLSSTWSHAPLFCSPLTAKLIPSKFPRFDLSLLRILQPNTPYTLSLSSPSPTTLHVTAINACHCPGSIMLLFRGEFGCVLHTGDFRWEPNCEKASEARRVLRHALQDVPGVDVLYLDNTYSNPIYDFPPRHVAALQVIDIISSHPDHDIIIGINTLGKEDLLIEISRVLQIKIWVWPERLRTMHLLGFNDIFTTNTSLTRVRAVPQYSFSVETLEALNAMRPTIGIMPSGLPWIKRSLQNNELLSGSFLTSRYKRGKWSENSEEAQIDKQMGNVGSSPEKIHQYMYSVPYSDHSNFEEIEDFIKLVRPTSLKGIVSSSSCYIEPMYYFGRLCRVNNHSTQQLQNRYKRKESSPRTSFGGTNVESDGGRRKVLKGKFSGVRVSRFSILRRKHRGAKIQKDNSPDQD